MNVSIKLLSRILKILNILKILKNNQQKILFSKKGKIYEFSKNRGICERALSGVYVYKGSSSYLEKCPCFGVLKVENGHFHAISDDFCIFPIFIFFRFGPFKKCSMVIFRVLDEKLTQKHVSGCPNPKFSVWPFLDLVTLNDLDLEYAHRKLRIILRSVSDTIFAVVWLISISYCSSARQVQILKIVKHFHFDLTCDVISDLEVDNISFPSKILQIYRTPFEFCKSDE